MVSCYKKRSLVLLALAFLVLAGLASAALQSGQPSEQALLEERGIDIKAGGNQTGHNGNLILDALPDSVDVLLIPESTDDYVGMYDPETGDFLGYFIPSFGQFQTPICAIAGPDNNIYISDQVSDAVFVFDRDGNYIETYADGSDGLNNIRGIAFRDGHLFVTSGDDYVAEFDGPHSRLDDFINDGSDSFDILFLDDGRCLLSDIYGSTDNVRLYDAEGNLINEIFSADFPEQLQMDNEEPGEYLVSCFSANMICDFTLDNSYNFQIPWSSGRGVYRLGNGNILATNGNGVFELDPSSGSIISQKNTGSGRFIELIPAESPNSIGESGTIPSSYSLAANYPNPFNASTMIKYGLPQDSRVTIEIYDVLGHRVTTLCDEMQTAGYHQVIWDASSVATGMYFYKIKADNYTQTRKMLLVK